MTIDEAAALRVGDCVKKKIRGKWVIVELVRQASPTGKHWHGSWYARRIGRRDNGKPWPAVWSGMDVCQPCSRLDSVTGNVFADFLDDHGEHRAAALLRQAFPCVDAEGNTT